MERKRLHLNGPELSRIVAGAWRWHTAGPGVVEILIHTAIENGITSFDHADIFGDYENEKLFGNVLKKSPSIRHEIQLISKCGVRIISGKQPGTWIRHYDTSKEHILKSVDESLSRLRTHYLDLLLIHRPDPLMNPEEVAEAFGLLKQNGKVLYFGVSNFSATQFEMLQSYLPFPLVTNQIEVSLTNLKPFFDGTIDVLMKYGTSPMAWSPIGGGKLMKVHAIDSVLWAKKEKYGANETQLSLAWLLRHPSGIFPVIGTTRPDRIRDSVQAAGIKLDRQDWFEMLRISSGENLP